MLKREVKTSNLHGIVDPIYTPTFNDHMKKSHRSGSTHAGLHLCNDFTKDDGRPLTWADVSTKGAVISGRMGLANRAATFTIKDFDTRARTFSAEVDIYGTAKYSTFFPIGTDLATAKGYIIEAYQDHCKYGTTDFGGGKVDIYSQMCTRFGLQWVGMATINRQQVWVGTQISGSVKTAFPAVNNKFK